MRHLVPFFALALVGALGLPTPALGQITPDDRWDGRFAHPYPGINGAVYALAIDPNGNLYAGGFFGGAGGVATANNIARWSAGTWWAMGAGVNDRINSLVVDGGGNVFAGGNFVTAGGASAKSD